ncbi:putative porin [Mucilaginibacter sp. RB4R14]|uniref:putative porin n=1 Tax=Mucilaginibacter aurantiaciroseus TaxID=2949308 RepID=UPI0020905817|nr:putative porin [Mucilaginibacter aurantiaciroseus]MCO5934077.1 putative porin [Mucilaginibacter aurantiaciroseus]
MANKLKYLLILLLCASVQGLFAQINNTRFPGQNKNDPVYKRDTVKNSRTGGDSQNLDSIRKREENRKDSIVFTSKFIKVTSERLLMDSIQLFPLDTGLVNFENYSPLNQPRNPKISLGYPGVAQRDLLFNPRKTIGFDEGLHALDAYMVNPQDINYFNARAPYTLLSLFSSLGGSKEQLFKVVHTQNVKPNWNVGLLMNFNGSRGYYSTNGILAQNVSDFNFGLFTWYHTVNKRYNLLANVLFNNLKAPETGSILKDTIFNSSLSSFDKTGEPVRLPGSFNNWKSTGIYIKQFYYIGHIDSLNQGKAFSKTVLPTQRVSYTLYFNQRKYNYLQNGLDNYGVFPDYYFSSARSRDSLNVTHLQNDFSYSFYLRGKSLKMVKNELKIDVGLTQDYYKVSQFVADTVINQFGNKEIKPSRVQNESFQNITLKGRLGYKFSDRIVLDADLRQIVQGRNFGDLLYDVKLALAGGKKAGKIVLGGYLQSSSPGLVYTNWISNHYIFNNTFSNQKTTNLSFNYVNDALQLDLKAEYFLITDYLYFAAQPGGIDASPRQYGSIINMLKVSLGKNVEWRKFHFDNYIVYQKTDNAAILRTPEVYTYSSLYYGANLFHVLNSQFGVSARYNSQYLAPSYAVGLGQFYNGPDVKFTSYPIATVFFKATLEKTNLFIQYDYANQGLFSNGFYTVNRYPQMDKMLKFGVAWTFYN